MKRLSRVAVVIMTVLLFGCGPTAQEKQKWESFKSHVVIADARYRFSFSQVRKILSSAAEYGDDAMLSAVRQSNLSVWIKTAKEGAQEIAGAEEDFSWLYANSKEVPPSIKSDLYRFKEIVDANARFIQDCQNGRIPVESTKSWVDDMNKYESVYQSVHLEVKKVFTKQKWDFSEWRT